MRDGLVVQRSRRSRTGLSPTAELRKLAKLDEAAKLDS